MNDKLEINTKAQELREMLGEDANSPLDIFALVSQIEGLTLVFYPLGENISGMCMKDEGVRLIAINSTMSYGRQRFTLACLRIHRFHPRIVLVGGLLLRCGCLQRQLLRHDTLCLRHLQRRL